jgi:hypothetical protein
MSDYRVKAQCPVVDCEGVIITGICPVCGLKTPPMQANNFLKNPHTENGPSENYEVLKG